MRYWQMNYEASAQALTLGNVDVVPPKLLPTHGYLSGLLLRFSGSPISGYSAGGGKWRIIDFISKIEVLLNEAVICKSYSGSIAKGICGLDQGVLPIAHTTNYATSTQFDWVLINFGRRLYDPEYGLDLSKYDSIKLQITNTGAASTWGDITVAVLGIYLKDTAGPVVSKGYMRTETWKSWATVANQVIYSQLPVEYKIRRILLQAIAPLDANNLQTTGFENLMSNIVLAARTYDITLFNGALQELARVNHLDRGAEFMSGGESYMTAGKGFNTGLGYLGGGAWGAGDHAGTVATVDPTLDGLRNDSIQDPISFQVDHPINFLFRGLAPEYLGYFRFDQDNNPMTWLDPNVDKTVECDITTRNAASAAGGTNNIILDRLVPYG